MQSSSERSLPLSFLLIKKSTSIISQLAKFLETGRGEGLRMDTKTREKLKKYKFFASLEKTIRIDGIILDSEMKHLQGRFTNDVQLISETLGPLDDNLQLRK
jgi:hypothetical protein